MSVPAIPVTCAHRPRRGGLVVPYVSFEHNGAVVFGGVDPVKRAVAFEHGLCQICERPLRERLYVLVRPQDVGVGYSPEPGLHPQCLVYSEQACPMLNGAAATYRKSGVIAGHPAGRRCEDPGCSCPVTELNEEGRRRAGSKADDWGRLDAAAGGVRAPPRCQRVGAGDRAPLQAAPHPPCPCLARA